jgi:hypothetical protein
MTQRVAHLRQELDVILQAARRGMLMASGIQVRI